MKPQRRKARKVELGGNSLRLLRSEPFLLFALVAAGIALRLIVLTGQSFDGLYGQDSFAYYDFAQELRAAANAGSTPPPFFWPLGYPALLAGTFAIFGTSAEIGQALNIVLGALLPPLVYILTREMGQRRPAAFAAALVMLFGGQILQSSVVLMSDVPALFWATLSAVGLVVYTRRRHFGWLVLAAVALAFACITRWLYLVLIVPYGAVFLLERGKLRHGVIAGLGAVLVFVPQLAFSANSPFPTLNHAWVQGWSPENALRSAFVNVDGTFAYSQVNALFYGQIFHDPRFLAPILTPMLLVGLWALRSRLAWLVLLEGWVLLPYAFLSGIPYQNIRFPLIVMPAIAILCGVGVDWVARRTQKFAPLQTIVYGGVVGLGAVWMLSTGVETTHHFIARQVQDREVAIWASEQLPEGATVYTFDLTLTLRHRTSLNVIEIYYETPDTLAERWVRGRTDYLLVNLWQIESQWRGREPYIAVYWLQAYRGLQRLGQYGNYTLFRVGG